MLSAILTYHSIDASGSVISTSPALFRSHMETLSRSGTAIVPLSDIQKRPGSIAITFDDGFANFEEHALPLLRKYEFPATVFLVSGHCGGYNDWPTQSPSVPQLPLMSWPCLQRITGAAITWGAHTVSHPDLTKMQEAEVAREMGDCREEIQQRTGMAVDCLAYPYGAVNRATRRVAELEFTTACGTRLCLLRGGENHWELPRIDAYYLRNPAFFSRLLEPAGRAYLTGRRVLRETRAWLFR